MWGFGKPIRRGQVARGTKQMIRGREEKGLKVELIAKGQWFNHSCLLPREASMKTEQDQM